MTPGTTYYYQVAELDAQGNQSPWSNTVTVTTPLAALPAPANVTATAYAPGTAPARVVLTWTQYPPVTRFIVERATNAHFTLGFRRVRARAWTRTVTLGGLLRNHRYYVRIRAVNGYLTSRWTTVKVITPSSTGADFSDRANRVAPGVQAPCVQGDVAIWGVTRGVGETDLSRPREGPVARAGTRATPL